MFKRFFLIVAIATIGKVGTIGAQAQVSEMEKAFNGLSDRFEKRDTKNLVMDLKSYLTQYPYSTYEDEVRFMIGATYMESNAYKNASKELAKLEMKRLTRPHRQTYLFYQGYAHLMLQEFDKASIYFGQLAERRKGGEAERLKGGEAERRKGGEAERLKGGEAERQKGGEAERQKGGEAERLKGGEAERLKGGEAERLKGGEAERLKGGEALYYYSFCQYRLGNYEEALPGFLALEQEGEYKQTVPSYITQIYYYQHLTDSARTRATRLLEEKKGQENNNVTEMHRILGEIGYHEEDYKGAIEHLRYYVDHPIHEAEPERNDLYLLGRAYYVTKDNLNATTYLKQIKNLKDTISESAFFMMGNAYVQLDQIDQARLSYQGALDINLTPSLREEAMFNYTLTTYRTSTAIGESVEAFTSFLKAYPRSKHSDEIFQLMSQAFMQSKNYQAALDALDSIPNPTKDMLETKQYLRYQLATDAYAQGKMTLVIPYMEVLLANTGGEVYKKDAHYFIGEAHYRLKDYKEAQEDIQLYLAQPDAPQLSNYTAALYLKAYIAFSQHNYTAAKEDFKTYVQTIDMNDATYADAYNRMGDCYFNGRQFNEAVEAYEKVANLNTTGSVYALFQKGYAEGLMKNYDKKIETLQQLVHRYPTSDYADDALYETARAQLQKKDNAAAVVSYRQLLTKYPKSNKARQSHLEIAMLYRNMGQYDAAIEAYKQTITQYPAGEEAYAALAGLEATYMETNRIEEYLDYTKTLDKMHMSVTTQDDSLTYAAAELQYMLGHYPEAIKSLTTYLDKYCPGGRYCTTATYYAATAYDQLGKTEEALKHYIELGQIEGNSYREEAFSRMATIYYEKKLYSAAMDAYEHLSQLSADKQRVYKARLGMIHCAEALKQEQTIIDIASLMLIDTDQKEEIQEVSYYRAKAYIATQQYELAIADMNELRTQVQTAMGAETKYLTAECYYHLGALDNAENEIISFTQQKTQQQYWLAKALILLSDIYLQRGDEFQAQQYLLSLQNNYKRTQDDILSIVKEKLKKIEE